MSLCKRIKDVAAVLGNVLGLFSCVHRIPECRVKEIYTGGEKLWCFALFLYFFISTSMTGRGKGDKPAA